MVSKADSEAYFAAEEEAVTMAEYSML